MTPCTVRDLRPIAEACRHDAMIVIKGSDIKIVKVEFQHIPTPMLFLTPSSPVVGPDCLDPESPLLAPANYPLPALLHALALGRSSAEQSILCGLADLIQKQGSCDGLDVGVRISPP